MASNPPNATAAAATDRPAITPVAPTTGFFGHPRGLATLFFTEYWERFSFYGMKALLLLFMTKAVADGGLGFSDRTGGAIFGIYGSLVYLTALPGGWIADRIMGQRRAVFLGGCIIALGHFSMAIPNIWTFFLGLALIVTGTGLLKPNVSTMVGELYPEGGARRDAGFSIFYMGINLGAMIAPLVCSPLGENVNWHYGFAAAGVGMVLGLIQYALGGKHLGTAGLMPNAGTNPAERSKAVRILVIASAVVLIGVGLIATGLVQLSAERIAQGMGVVIFIFAVVTLLFQLVGGGLDATETKKMLAIFVLFVFSALFWSGFEQAPSSLNLFANRLTDRVIFGHEIAAGTLQSINPAFIILFAPVFAWIWIALARRGWEPSAPAKFAMGLILVGIGFLVMRFAAIHTQNGTVQVSPMWLVTTYLFHTFGELCLSPVGLSTVTKLAPHRKVSQMMGVWFMSISLGNLLAGLIAGRFSDFPLPKIFGAVFLTTAGAGVILALFVKPIRRLMSGVH
jgi:POT family proton-dependent oligopeptide transporter